MWYLTSAKSWRPCNTNVNHLPSLNCCKLIKRLSELDVRYNYSCYQSELSCCLIELQCMFNAAPFHRRLSLCTIHFISFFHVIPSFKLSGPHSLLFQWADSMSSLFLLFQHSAPLYLSVAVHNSNKQFKKKRGKNFDLV